MFYLLQLTIKKMITKGALIITDAQGLVHHFGDDTGTPIHLRILSQKWERDLTFNPALKLGEAYMKEGIEFLEGNIYQLFELLFSNIGRNPDQQLWMKAHRLLRRAKQSIFARNTLANSPRHIRHHYDLSEALYRLFLDPDRQYSCAYFETPGQSLNDAQLAKKRHLAAKLQIQLGQSVLDIGCGWGGLGLYLARFLKAHVTGVTLSHEQHNIANKRAKKEGLTKQVKFLLQDYRLLDEQYDKIVSVGMFEHVGPHHYKEYFTHIKKLLKPEGRFVLHSIGRSGPPYPINPWIAKYIFPGGYIPALSEVLPIIEKVGLIVTDIEILRLHYAETLKAWSKTFLANRDKVKALYDECFCRMWEFYLAASESAFRYQGLMVFQIQMAHKQEAVPLTRDYISQEEARLKELEAKQDIS